MRVPTSWPSNANIDLVVRFNGGSFGKFETVRPLKDLTKEKPDLETLLSAATDLETENKHAAALASLERAVKLYGDDPSALNAIAWLLLTCDDKRLRDVERAYPLAKKAAELSRNQRPEVLDTLAVAEHARGNVAKADALMKKVMELWPDAPADVAGRARDYAREAKAAGQ